MEALPFVTSADSQAGVATVATAPLAAPMAGEGRQEIDATAPQGGMSEPHDPWPEQFGQLLLAQHGRVREFLDRQRERWSHIEAQLGDRIKQLTTEVETLRGTCEQLQQEIAEPSTPASQADGECSDAEGIARRYQMALEDIRDLKARNSELQKQLAQTPTSHPEPRAIGSGSGLNWEAEKRRILAVLESDSGGNDADRTAGRREIEDIVRRTDRLLAEKTREIEELQNLLKNQSDNFGSVAVGAAALEQLLDQDAIVCEERANLKRLQEECREKLRQAEVNISLERAKLARQQAEIEERLRLAELRTKPVEDPGDALCPTGRPVRGRWLARLGLTDVDEPPSRAAKG